MSKTNMRKRIVSSRVGFICLFWAWNATAVEFNLDVLDVKDRENVDFSRFSQAGYIMPGKYQLRVIVNGQEISPSSFLVPFIDDKEGAEKDTVPRACLTSDMIELMAFTPASMEKITYLHDDECADLTELKGIVIRPNVGEGMLYIDIPTALLEYSDSTWAPPSRWEDGLTGVILDYNINGNVSHRQQGEANRSVSYNGTAGVNWGPWRLRADYQGNQDDTESGGQDNSADISESDDIYNQSTISRIYMYRAIPAWQSKVMLGEGYVNSPVFNSWNYVGISLESDEQMLPPKFRGYAPEVTGVADTNARVIVSQQGRILYDSTVPAGPFAIQELGSNVQGMLDVEVIEQNGQKKTYQVDSGYVPYLTRPGQVRYKLASGQALSSDQATVGPMFVTGEVSWGLSNVWSLFGGATIADDYDAVALGVARDLRQYGSLSFDVTQSSAHFPSGSTPGQHEENLKGKSLRVSYSKEFDESEASLNFAGYRFSEQDYMTMQQYIDTRYNDTDFDSEKEQYSISFNKGFSDIRTTVGLQFNRQTYWDSEKTKYYSAYANHYFDAFGIQGISIGVNATRSDSGGNPDESLSLTLSIPWDNGTFSYQGNANDGRYSQTVGYSGTTADGLDNYSVTAGLDLGDGEQAQARSSAYYNHRGERADFSANVSSVQNEYTSFGLNLTGGITMTGQGVALHSGGMNGATRLLVDTDGVADVPIDGGQTTTNQWGIGVVTGVSNYYRNTTSVDLTKLPDDVAVTQSVVESVLTEGAIGYREFKVLKGGQVFAVVTQTDGSFPPFGATVSNADGRELGMVGDDGLTWLTGVNAGERLAITWSGKKQCTMPIPGAFKTDEQLMLVCTSGTKADQ